MTTDLMFDAYKFSVIVSEIGNEEIMFAFVIFVAAMLFVFKKYRNAFIFTTSVTIAMAIVYLMKNTFQIERPQDMLVSEGGYRFPSGHATMAGVLVSLYFLSFYDSIKKKYKKYAIGLALLSWYGAICFSRVFLKVHVFVDILVGGLVAAFSVWLAIYVYDWYRRGR